MLEPPEGGEWFLDYDEDNAAFLYSDNHAIDPIPCDEMLAEMVCVGEDGEQYTVLLLRVLVVVLCFCME